MRIKEGCPAFTCFIFFLHLFVSQLLGRMQVFQLQSVFSVMKQDSLEAEQMYWEKGRVMK